MAPFRIHTGMCINAFSLLLPALRLNGLLTRVLPQPAEGIEEVPDIGPLHAHFGSSNGLCEAQEK